MTTTHDIEPEAQQGERGPRPRALIIGMGAAGLVMAVGLGFAAGRSTADQPSGLVSQEVAEMLEARIAAVNGAPGAEVASFYGPGAVLEEQDQHPAVVTVGAEQISDHLAAYRGLGFTLHPGATPAIRLGRYVAEGLTWSSGGGIVVYQLDDDGRISYQWVIGGAP